jgi:hypothetical protein
MLLILRDCEIVEAVPAPSSHHRRGHGFPWGADLGDAQQVHRPLTLVSSGTDRSPLRPGTVPSTMGGWVGRVGVALKPLVDRLREMMLQLNTLHGDETPVRQLDLAYKTACSVMSDVGHEMARCARMTKYSGG